jgi:hypothetical protein
VNQRFAGHRRRGQTAFCWAAGAFVAIQFMASLLLDYAWPEVRFPYASRVLGQVAAGRPMPEVVLFGSSRVAGGLRTREMGQELQAILGLEQPPAVLNAGLPAGDLISADYMLEHLLNHGVRPSLAVIEVNPETLNRYNEWFFFHVRRQLRWDDVPAYLRDICRARQGRRLLAARLTPISVHRGNMRRAVLEWIDPRLVESIPLDAWSLQAEQPMGKPATRPSKPLTWAAVLERCGEVPTAQQRHGTLAGVDQPYRWLRHYHIGGTSGAALERIVQRCREHDIEPILVGVPVTLAHRQAYTPPIEAAYLQHMRAVARRHGCVFVDYRDRLPDALFLDNHHVLPEGGWYFTRQLTREVLAPAWRAPSTEGPALNIGGF